jgi:Fe-S cluster biogenesis protein NfuA
VGRCDRDGGPHARPHEGVRFLISPGTVNPLAVRIEAALERIRPAIQRDGGDVWLVKIEDDVAFVQMIGACGGCPASHMTLKRGIEAVVREDVPEIRAVEQL